MSVFGSQIIQTLKKPENLVTVIALIVAVIAGKDGQVTGEITAESAPRRFTVRDTTLLTANPTLTPTPVLTLTPTQPPLVDHSADARLQISAATPNPKEPGECLPPYPFLYFGGYDTPFQEVILRVPLDDMKIPIAEYGFYGWIHNIGNIAQMGMYGVREWCLYRDPLGYQVAIYYADWLVDNAIYGDDFAVWVYDAPNPPLNAPTRWTSAFSNGKVIALLTKVYALTGEPIYLETARLGVNGFMVDAKDYGVRSRMPDGESFFYEEVAHPEAPSDSHILNGHIYGVQGLALYADYTGDETALALVDEGLESVRRYLDDFDYSISNLYMLNPPGTRGRLNYPTNAHIEGLIWAYDRTHDPIFLKYALRWMHQKWPAIPADMYEITDDADTFPGAFVVAEPDANAHSNTYVYFSDDVREMVLDLREVTTMRSFGYSCPDYQYPTDYRILVSEGGERWQEVLVVEDHDQPHALYFFDKDITARYIRMDIEATHDDVTPRLGPVRADSPTYWEKPVLLAVNDGGALATTSYNLSDDDPETTVAIGSRGGVIYGDLQTAAQPSKVKLEGSADPAQYRVRMAVSNDLETWTYIVGEQTHALLMLPGEIDLPAVETPWRYFRLEIWGNPLEIASLDLWPLSSEAD